MNKDRISEGSELETGQKGQGPALAHLLIATLKSVTSSPEEVLYAWALMSSLPSAHPPAMGVRASLARATEMAEKVAAGKTPG